MNLLRNRILVIILASVAAPMFGLSQESGAVRTLKVQKSGAVEVSIVNGDIHVTGWNREEVSIRAEGLMDEDARCLNVSQQGNTIRISMRGGCEGSSVDISVPSSFDVDVRSSDGDIEIKGPLSGNIKGSTAAGNVILGNLGGHIEMETAGGDISAGDLHGDASLSTRGGNVTVGKVTGETLISSSGGDITAASSGGRVRAKTLGGNVVIGNIGADADIVTTGGDVELGDVAGNASMKTAGGNLTLRSAHGTISASTAGGDIRLETISGSVDAETAGGNIVAGLAPRGESSLSSAGGDVRLFVPDGTKATIQARVIISSSDEESNNPPGIKSDFPIDDARTNESGVIVRGSVRLNGGGDLIRLETHDGQIEIRKGKPRD